MYRYIEYRSLVTSDLKDTWSRLNEIQTGEKPKLKLSEIEKLKLQNT